MSKFYCWMPVNNGHPFVAEYGYDEFEADTTKQAANKALLHWWSTRDTMTVCDDCKDKPGSDFGCIRGEVFVGSESGSVVSFTIHMSLVMEVEEL